LVNQPWQAGAYLVDLDGTLVSDGKPLPGAKRLLALMQDRFVLVSNDAEHTPAQLARLLAGIGLSIESRRILLAGTCALDLIARERPAARVMLLGSAALRRYGERLGLAMTMRDPGIVLVGRDRSFTYAKLSMAANAVREGANLIAANPDLTHPGRGGAVVPETGALLAAILACTGAVPHRIIGKPEPELFARALALLAVPAAQAVMVGDNPHTDGAGARRLGMRYVAIEPGRPLALLET
jgi:HAD superfamily hydrolase (TIGR01450 family)